MKLEEVILISKLSYTVLTLLDITIQFYQINII